MNQETLTQLQDFRSRIVKAKSLEAANEPVPEGLIPTDEEIRVSLLALRESRGKTSARQKPAGQIPADFDLNDLFKS